jgi:hypothetical protein
MKQVTPIYLRLFDNLDNAVKINIDASEKTDQDAQDRYESSRTLIWCCWPAASAWACCWRPGWHASSRVRCRRPCMWPSGWPTAT